jgi:hypothetical protein
LSSDELLNKLANAAVYKEMEKKKDAKADAIDKEFRKHFNQGEEADIGSPNSIARRKRPRQRKYMDRYGMAEGISYDIYELHNDEDSEDDDEDEPPRNKRIKPMKILNSLQKVGKNAGSRVLEVEDNLDVFAQETMLMSGVTLNHAIFPRVVGLMEAPTGNTDKTPAFRVVVSFDAEGNRVEEDSSELQLPRRSLSRTTSL